MDKITTIQLKEDFVRWLKTMGKKGESYQDVILKILFRQSPERIEELLRRNAYDYHALARRLGIRLKEDKM